MYGFHPFYTTVSCGGDRTSTRCSPVSCIVCRIYHETVSLYCFVCVNWSNFMCVTLKLVSKNRGSSLWWFCSHWSHRSSYGSLPVQQWCLSCHNLVIWETYRIPRCLCCLILCHLRTQFLRFDRISLHVNGYIFHYSNIIWVIMSFCRPSYQSIWDV